MVSQYRETLVERVTARTLRASPRRSYRARRRNVARDAGVGLVVALALLAAAPPASAYVECGDPPGPARNVTAVGVSCADARAFARKAAARGVTRSGAVALPGWRVYRARVRRVGGEYDVRATRGPKVIRFQYRRSGSGRQRECDPNYAGACLDPNSPDYDCAGGSGDGPDYTGPVRVVGEDVHGLDGDGDGYACEA